MSRTVIIGSDHAGFALKHVLVEQLKADGYNVVDLGPASAQSCDYPVYAQSVCERVLAADNSNGPETLGILVCGTGIGMSMAANRIPGIRAALCACEFHARGTRQHNNANVICLGERVTGPGLAMDMVRIFLETPFEGGRHQRRIEIFDK
ncbi:MAG: ribose 5-phosphate isomerase B [Pseudomonadota bacterium]